MKTKSTFLIIVFILLLVSENFAQQLSTGACLGTFAVNPISSTRAWLRGGNNNAGVGVQITDSARVLTLRFTQLQIVSEEQN